MGTIDKHISLQQALATETTLLARAKRINIEQKYPPHFRTFVAIGASMTKEELRAIEDIAERHSLLCNPFRTAHVVTSITFADSEEGSQG
jgi:hypothetical protein